MIAIPGPIAVGAAGVAESLVGVHEVGGNNRGPDVELFLVEVGLDPGYAWCCAFVQFCLARAAREVPADRALAAAPSAAAREFLVGTGLAAITGEREIPRTWPKTGWCPDAKAWAMRHAVWIPAMRASRNPWEVQRGDLALFYFPAKQRVAHIGMVTGAGRDDSYFPTVEGNTGPDTSPEIEVRRDGDGVYRKSRRWNELGAEGGFARLPF